MAQRQRSARCDLYAIQEVRGIAEVKARAARFRRGVLGLWDRVTGKHSKLRAENERDALACSDRDAAERQAQIEQQLRERKALQKEIDDGRRIHARDLTRLHRALAEQPPLGETTETPRQQPDHPNERPRRRTRILSL